MKLLVNDKEIAKYLVSLIDFQSLYKDVPYHKPHLTEAINYAVEEKSGDPRKLQKKKQKIKDKIISGVTRDLREYLRAAEASIHANKKNFYLTIHKNLDLFLERLGKEEVIENFRNSNVDGFVKSVGLHIDPSAEIVRRAEFNDVNVDCVLRNTVGNEQFLVAKIDNNLPFWFIDSGYTNFVENNKKWHRLVRNHLHSGKFFDAPVDRLGIFKKFPAQWRTGGDKILVIEPGEFAASIFHVDINSWRNSVQEELRKYTDKEIVFREKAPKKKRDPLYKHLLKEDYYCVVSINSNAATESIWAGIPAITLGTHITNPVTRNSLSDINNLYRGNLSNWLCMLSYSQFTYEELADGTAVEILRKYHV